MTRVYLLAIIALLLLGVVLWYQHATDYRPRPLTTTQLHALADEQLSRQLLDDLALRAFAPGVARSEWQRFNQPARHVWALGVVESGSDSLGLGGFIAYHDRDPGFPRVEDARDACRAVGLGEAADILAMAQGSNDLGAIHTRWRQALDKPAALACRRAYMREHLAALADPYSTDVPRP